MCDFSLISMEAANGLVWWFHAAVFHLKLCQIAYHVLGKLLVALLSSPFHRDSRYSKNLPTSTKLPSYPSSPIQGRHSAPRGLHFHSFGELLRHGLGPGDLGRRQRQPREGSAQAAALHGGTGHGAAGRRRGARTGEGDGDQGHGGGRLWDVFFLVEMGIIWI